MIWVEMKSQENGGYLLTLLEGILEASLSVFVSFSHTSIAAEFHSSHSLVHLQRKKFNTLLIHS